MKSFLSATAMAVALAVSSPASAAVFPGFGADTLGPGITITLNMNGSTSFSTSGQGPYDGGDDTYVGVINNSGKTVSFLTLSSSTDIFGFDGDGLTAYGGTSPHDSSGYGGPLGFFTNINSSYTSGRVNFYGGLASGSSTYFALEEAVTGASFSTVTVASGVPEPSTWAMMLLGLAGLGFVGRRKATRIASAA